MVNPRYIAGKRRRRRTMCGQCTWLLFCLSFTLTVEPCVVSAPDYCSVIYTHCWTMCGQVVSAPDYCSVCHLHSLLCVVSAPDYCSVIYTHCWTMCGQVVSAPDYCSVCHLHSLLNHLWSGSQCTWLLFCHLHSLLNHLWSGAQCPAFVLSIVYTHCCQCMKLTSNLYFYCPPGHMPGSIMSVLGLVGLVSVYCDWVWQQVWSAACVLGWQLKMVEADMLGMWLERQAPNKQICVCGLIIVWCEMCWCDPFVIWSGGEGTDS